MAVVGGDGERAPEDVLEPEAPDVEDEGLSAQSTGIPAVDRLGVYPGFADVATFADVERWLGRGLDVVVQFGGARSPSDLSGSVSGQLRRADEWHGDRIGTYSLTVPLAFSDANARSAKGQREVRKALRSVADGDEDDAYRRVAEALVDAGHPHAVLRLGHEFDGRWFSWSAVENCDAYIAAFRHVAGVFLAVSDDFRFDWNGTVHNFAANAECAYPGDDVVDIVGLDIYDRASSEPTAEAGDGGTRWVDPDRVWQDRFLPGLEFHLRFAREHGKPVSFPEWGLSTAKGSEAGEDNPRFIRGMYEWMASLPASGPGSLAYHGYFLNNATHDVRQFPDAAEEFRRLFGVDAGR